MLIIVNSYLLIKCIGIGSIWIFILNWGGRLGRGRRVKGKGKGKGKGRWGIREYSGWLGRGWLLMSRYC